MLCLQTEGNVLFLLKKEIEFGNFYYYFFLISADFS